MDDIRGLTELVINITIFWKVKSEKILKTALNLEGTKFQNLY